MRILTGAASGDPIPGRPRRPGRRRLRYGRASRWSRSIPATTRCPRPNAWRWDQRTPDGFVFNIKAFRLFTGHQTPLSALPADIRAELDGWPAPFLYYNDVPGELRDELWRRYTLALEPLRLPGKQAPCISSSRPGYDATRGHAALAEAARRMDEHLISIELRHRSWFDSPAATAGTLALLRDLGAVHGGGRARRAGEQRARRLGKHASRADAVAAAWPQRGRLEPDHASLVGTLPVRIFRGRAGGTGRALSRLAAQSAQAHAVFNTNFEDQGVRNAARSRRRCRGSETRSPMRSGGSGAGRARRLARHFRQAVQQHLELARDVLLGHAGKPQQQPRTPQRRVGVVARQRTRQQPRARASSTTRRSSMSGQRQHQVQPGQAGVAMQPVGTSRRRTASACGGAA